MLLGLDGLNYKRKITMTEPTKEQVEKWRSEFEKTDYVRNYGYWRCLRKSFNGTYGDPDTERLWQGYLTAKKSDFEKIAELEKLSEMQARDAFSRYKEIKTLKEQLADAEKVIKFYGGDFNGKDGSKWFSDTFFIEDKFGATYGDNGKIARQYFAEKQDKENKE